ncbi:hypothetical protein EB001_20520 [bacterium]|nr:hypothetical protein [bacterium]
MPKIVLVETVSTFRHMYAVEVKDEDPIEYALDEVVAAATGGITELEEFAQKHIAEDTFSHREITEDEYLKIFDNENGYLKEWTAEQKKRFIYKPK